MRIQFFCLLLVLLSATELCEAQDFYEKNVNQNMMPADCTAVMNARINNNNDQKCVFANDFIVATNEEVDNVCANNGGKSAKRFDLVVCTHKKKTLPCEYTGNSLKSKIKLSCENQRPVKYIGPVA